ncbi:putative P-type Ca(2+) transporter [Helianthus anomalus]
MCPSRMANLERKLTWEQRLGWSTPFNVVQLIWVNLIMDTLGALALAKESPNDGLMIRSRLS